MTLNDNKSLKPFIVRGNEVRDGAGVRIFRLFGSPATFEFTDPFLLLDFFGSNDPKEYEMGFPWHPHRGIETLTYLLKGRIEHEDSIGNKGTLYPGEIQWMNSGSGIFHQEMPKQFNGDPETLGFQLWINLPKKDKMSKPRYSHVNVRNLRKINLDGNEIKIIAGKFAEEIGEAGISHPLGILYLDVSSNNHPLLIPKRRNTTSMIIPIEGNVNVGNTILNKMDVGIFGSDEGIIEIYGGVKSRYIYLSGTRTNDQISWYGPIVMNNLSEIQDSIRELENGTFIKDTNPLFFEI